MFTIPSSTKQDSEYCGRQVATRKRHQTIQQHHVAAVTSPSSIPTNNTAPGKTYDIEKARNTNGKVFQNWAHIHQCRPQYYHTPQTLAHIREIIEYATQHKQHISVRGAGHSPSDIAMNQEHLIDLSQFNHVLHMDKLHEKQQEKDPVYRVKVQSGITLGELNRLLDANGFAISCLGSISDQTVGGAIGTALHGTGDRYGVFSTMIDEVELLDGKGQLWQCSNHQNSDMFGAALCNLGCLGVVVHVTLRVERAFRLHEVQFPLTLSQALEPNKLKELIRSSDHTRLWWIPHTNLVQVTQQTRTDRTTTIDHHPNINWMKNKVFGFYLLEFLYFTARWTPSTIPYINKLYGQVLFNKNQTRVDRSDAIFNFDCLFKQYVNEWAIPQEHCAEAIIKIKQLIDKSNLKVHFPIEIRFVDKDNIYLSPCYGRRTCYIGIIMYRPYGHDVAYRQYFQAYEQIMLSLGGRPHWAKAFELTEKDFLKLYPQWPQFVKIRQQLDPNGVFANPFVKRVFDQSLTSQHNNNNNNTNNNNNLSVPQIQLPASL